MYLNKLDGRVNRAFFDKMSAQLLPKRATVRSQFTCRKFLRLSMAWDGCIQILLQSSGRRSRTSRSGVVNHFAGATTKRSAHCASQAPHQLNELFAIT
jgi:hypothetical protein